MHYIIIVTWRSKFIWSLISRNFCLIEKYFVKSIEKGSFLGSNHNILVTSTDFSVVFVLFELLELFEYLVTKYFIFEVELFVLELETLIISL